MFLVPFLYYIIKEGDILNNSNRKKNINDQPFGFNLQLIPVYTEQLVVLLWDKNTTKP